jgi:uncharacterized protein
MIPRAAAKTIARLARGFPIIALTGPRQSGKTTLARASFPGKPYVTLENPRDREFAEIDAERFLGQFKNGAVIDEIQRCPKLLSYLQGLVDERQQMADFIITGSAQFDLIAGITQTLAGRVAQIELLPFSLSELNNNLRPKSLNSLLFKGGYPTLYDRDLDPSDWFANYVATYLERDVRQLIAVRDLSLFQRFVKMCASRSGQLLNLSALGADCGISSVTAGQWLSVLEASYLTIKVPPYHVNFGKRLVKTPKLYFLDVGLMAWLLGIHDEASIETHSIRGALFETWVVSEHVKQRLNAGRAVDLFFWRDSQGLEIDLMFETNAGLQAVEIKSGETFASDWPVAIHAWQKLASSSKFASQQKHPMPRIIFGGKGKYERQGCEVFGWHEFS